MPVFARFKNFGGPNDAVFVTTNILGFKPVFRNPLLADLMTGSLLDDCRYYGAPLHAFVTMPDHIHFLCQVPLGTSVDWLLDRIKSNSAKRILPRLSDSDRRELACYAGSANRAFWLKGYRAHVVNSDKPFFDSMEYIHFNPVCKGLSAMPEDYVWSSASLIIGGQWDPDGGIGIDDDLIAKYCEPAALKFTSGREEPSDDGLA